MIDCEDGTIVVFLFFDKYSPVGEIYKNRTKFCLRYAFTTRSSQYICVSLHFGIALREFNGYLGFHLTLVDYFAALPKHRLVSK